MKKMNKKNLRFIIIFIVVIVCSCTYLYQSLYAKYRKIVTTQVDLSIADWAIKINNKDVKNNKVLTNKLVPKFEEYEYTKANVLDPGSKWYCDIVIKSTNVDVNFEITIQDKVPVNSSITDLKVTDYIINPIDTNTTKIAYNELQKIHIPVVHNTPKTVIRLYIKQDDDSKTQPIDNKADTNAAVNTASEALIKINIQKFYK